MRAKRCGLSSFEVVVSRSLRDSGKVKMGVSDPSPLSISFSFCVRMLLSKPYGCEVEFFVELEKRSRIVFG